MPDRPIILNTRPVLPSLACPAGDNPSPDAALSEYGGDEFTAAMAARNLRVIAAPLTVYRDLATPRPQGDFGALALTSRHAAAALLRPEFSDLTDLPVYCVGDATAAAAVEAGCNTVFSAAGDVTALAALMAEEAAADILFPCAADIAPATLPAFAAAGLRVTQWPVYAMDAATALPPEVVTALQDGGAVVPFFSGRAAEIFVRLAAEAGIAAQTRRTWGLCIARRMVKSVECLDWMDVLVAARPDMPSLIAEIDNLIARQGRIPA